MSSARRRVLIQNPMFPPYRVDLFKGLSNSSTLDPTFSFGLAHPDTSLVDVTEDHGLKLLPVKNHFVRNHTLTIQRGLLDHVRSQKWDAMIASFDPRMVMNLLARRIARRQGTRFIWWGHGIRPRQRFGSIYRRLALDADAVILYSGEGKRKLAELGVPAERLFVAWNSIDTQAIDSLRLQTWESRYRILTIGRLVAGKKIDLLLRAFHRALVDLPDSVVLSIVGEGPELAGLRALADELGIDKRVEWVGAVYDQVGLAPLFNTSLCSVAPGAVGLSIIQSLAFGVPMVYAQEEPHGPEVEALVPNLNSYAFLADSESELASVLIDAAKNPGRMKQLGDAGAAKVHEEFSVARMVQTFEAAVEYACTLRGGG